MPNFIKLSHTALSPPRMQNWFPEVEIPWGEHELILFFFKSFLQAFSSSISEILFGSLNEFLIDGGSGEAAFLRSPKQSAAFVADSAKNACLLCFEVVFFDQAPPPPMRIPLGRITVISV